MRLTAQEVFDKLIYEDKICELEGRITFYMGAVTITVRQRDVVGNIMQEWLQGWLDKNGIEYAVNENTQMPPDFFLNPDDRSKNLLEVKAFNRSAGPGFDIADFRMYEEEIIDKPYMLDVDYLIFGYDMSDDGIVTIKDVWLKKVWEITRRMEDWPINLQIKDKVVHKIRPGIWYSEDMSRVDYSIFESLEDFISAIEEAVYQNPKTHNDAAAWKSAFLKNYKKETGKELVIPRWHDIKDKYDLKAKRKRARAEEERKDAAEKLKLAMVKLHEAKQGFMKAENSGTEKQIAMARKRVQNAEEKAAKAKAGLEKAEEKIQNL